MERIQQHTKDCVGWFEFDMVPADPRPEGEYPRRFESRKTGKSGYQPACANEWVRGLCEKPRVKCTECPSRRFLPVTDEAIRWHLSGQDDSGRGESVTLTCYFSANC